MYAAKGSLASILLAIFKATSIGTRLFAPVNYIQYTNNMLKNILLLDKN